jgi:hypothetical protein
MNPLIEAFLSSYVEYIGWNELPDPPQGADAIMRRICEEQKYSPDYGREFILIAFGWMWGRSKENMPFIESNVFSGFLKYKLDEVYTVVAKEQGW